MLARLFNSLPQQCWLCHGAAAAPLCAACGEDFERQGQCCWCCARPLGSSGCCGMCLRKPPAYTQVHAAFVYSPPLTPVVQMAKYGGQLSLCHHLGTLMSRQLPAELAGVCVPIPLSSERLRARAYNQSAEIGKALAHARALRIEHDWLSRVRDTAAQVGLTAQQRRKNLRHAFLASTEVAGQAILLIDDVMTTGTTVHEAARALKIQGAKSVSVLILARAHPRLAKN